MELTKRPRRLRRSEAVRSLVRETHLRVDDLICPLFVTEGEKNARAHRRHARPISLLGRRAGR